MDDLQIYARLTGVFPSVSGEDSLKVAAELTIAGENSLV